MGGTTTFTRHQKGCYMDLLMAQFNEVALTIEDIQQILGPDDFKNHWESKLKAKFETESNGRLYFNRKLRNEFIKRKKWCVSRNNNIEGKNQHSVGHMTSHMTGHMENRNENENIVKRTTKKKFTPPTLDQVKAYCLERKSPIDPETFFHTYEGSGWVKANGLPVLNWKSTIVTWEKKEKPKAMVVANGTPRKEEPVIRQKPDPKQQEEVAKLMRETVVNMGCK